MAWTEVGKWDARQRQLKDERKLNANVINGGMPTPTSANEKSFVERIGAQIKRQQTSSEAGETITQTAKSELHSELRGEETTETGSSHISGPGILNTANEFEPRSIQIVERETQSPDYSEQSESACLVASPSMNLLDDTANHLHALMKGLVANRPEPGVRAYDPEVVNASCNCAKQIYSIMRLKLDAIQVQRKRP